MNFLTVIMIVDMHQISAVENPAMSKHEPELHIGLTKDDTCSQDAYKVNGVFLTFFQLFSH